MSGLFLFFLCPALGFPEVPEPGGLSHGESNVLVWPIFLCFFSSQGVFWQLLLSCFSPLQCGCALLSHADSSLWSFFQTWFCHVLNWKHETGPNLTNTNGLSWLTGPSASSWSTPLLLDLWDVASELSTLHLQVLIRTHIPLWGTSTAATGAWVYLHPFGAFLVLQPYQHSLHNSTNGFKRTQYGKWRIWDLQQWCFYKAFNFFFFYRRIK